MYAYIQDQWIYDLTNQDMNGNSGWFEIDGDADDYEFRNADGLPCLKYINGEIVEDQSYPKPEPSSYVSDLERIRTLEKDNDMLTECILEMSEIIYGE